MRNNLKLGNNIFLNYVDKKEILYKYKKVREIMKVYKDGKVKFYKNGILKYNGDYYISYLYIKNEGFIGKDDLYNNNFINTICNLNSLSLKESIKKKIISFKSKDTSIYNDNLSYGLVHLDIINNHNILKNGKEYYLIDYEDIHFSRIIYQILNLTFLGKKLGIDEEKYFDFLYKKYYSLNLISIRDIKFVLNDKFENIFRTDRQFKKYYYSLFIPFLKKYLGTIEE